MAMWMYLPDRRLTKTEIRDMPKVKLCLGCGGDLARVAERNTKPPYQWTPFGYICTKCNVCYMGVV